jgi:hypothetical protein
LKQVMNDKNAREAKVSEAEALAAAYKAEVINAKLAGYYKEILEGSGGGF